MIVHDFDIVRVTRSPNEADAVLIVDPNAVLPLAIATQSLESVAGRHPKIANVSGGMQHEKLAVGSLQHITRNEIGALALEDRSRVLACPRLDRHGRTEKPATPNDRDLNYVPRN